MKPLQEQTDNQRQKTGDELIKVLIGTVTANGEVIRENTEQLNKLSDMTDLLQELGERMDIQGKRMDIRDKRLDSLGDGQEGLRVGVDEVQKGFGKMEEGFQKTAERLSFPVTDISDLRVDLQRHAAFFEQPQRKEIHYRHFLGKSLLALIGCGVAITVLVTLLVQAYGRLGEHAENDLKWRYLNVTGGPGLAKVLDSVDQAYKTNPEQFKKDVTDEEDRQRKLFEAAQQEKRAQEEIRELGEKKKN